MMTMSHDRALHHIASTSVRRMTTRSRFALVRERYAAWDHGVRLLRSSSTVQRCCYSSTSTAAIRSSSNTKTKVTLTTAVEEEQDAPLKDTYFKVKRNPRKLGEHPLKNPEAVADILGAVKQQQQQQQKNENKDALSSPSTSSEEEPTEIILSAAQLLAKIKTNPPRLPSKTHKPKQSLSQNYLNNSKAVADIIRAFHGDALLHCEGTDSKRVVGPIVELGPGIGALTDPLYQIYGSRKFQCIELDQRSVDLLQKKHPDLRIHHDSVLKFDYRKLSLQQNGEPLTIIGNLPYNVTTKVLHTLAHAAAHHGSIRSATVTLQWEVAEKVQATTNTKAYGILAITLQLYTHQILRHLRIPPTVFYPQPKVQSALVGLHFICDREQLQERLDGVEPAHIRQVLDLTFHQRRKTLRNSLPNVYKAVYGDELGMELVRAELVKAQPPPLTPRIQARADSGDFFAARQQLPSDWPSKRPEALTPGQFVELTRLVHSHRVHRNNDNGNDEYDSDDSDDGDKSDERP